MIFCLQKAKLKMSSGSLNLDHNYFCFIA